MSLHPTSPDSTPLAHESQCTILLVEDHDLVRFGLVSLMKATGGGDVKVLETSSLQQALALYRSHAAEIALVVLDLNLSDAKGLSALREFKRAHASARIVVLSGSVDDAITEEAIALGAERFLHKSNEVEQLAQMLRETLGRKIHTIPVRGPQAMPNSPGAKRLNLSPRELEILDLLLQGCSNQEIVDATGLKLGTVKNYISGLLVVFGVTSRSKLLTLFH